MKLLPSSLFENTNTIQASDFPRLLTLYEDDLPAPRCLDVELELWQSKWASNAEEAKNLDTPEKALVHAEKDYYPNIRSLMMIMVTIPVTSCECERSISILRLIKSRLRSTTGAERLNALTLMQCHRDIALDPDKIINEFARSHLRRFQL